MDVLKGELLALRPKGGSLFRKKLNLDIASELPELAIRPSNKDIMSRRLLLSVYKLIRCRMIY